MDAETKAQLDRVEGQLDATLRAAQSIRKMFIWTAIITAIVIVAPLIFLPFAISMLMSTYGSLLGVSLATIMV
jgi:hypothetical protein